MLAPHAGTDGHVLFQTGLAGVRTRTVGAPDILELQVLILCH
ncbi:MAG TPA: hypothetical protein VNK41_04775 [Vicinamibacterales bacterium]|nr:hypothetical protein [Vicinamibacterales bacterium]